MSNQIKMKYSEVKIAGNSSPPRTGAFEVRLNNELIFSKLQKNRFPTKDEISKW